MARRRRGPGGQGASGGRGAPAGWLGCDAGWPEEVDGDEQNAAAEAHDGEGAPVTDWQRKEAEELHGVEAKLARGSWRLGKVGSGGSTADSARRR